MLIRGIRHAFDAPIEVDGLFNNVKMTKFFFNEERMLLTLFQLFAPIPLRIPLDCSGIMMFYKEYSWFVVAENMKSMSVVEH